MKHWYILLAALAVATAFPPLPTKTKLCIDNCKCKPDGISSILQVLECDRPVTINETTFRYINKPGINVISLENLIIDQIQEDAFKDFKNLQDVLVLKSMIGSIDDKAFNNVKTLKFAHCGFEDSPDLFSEHLEELHFGNCHLEYVPKLSGLRSLTFLNLTGNYIKDIGIETFAELYDLEELYLSDNEIFKLPPTLFINNEALNSLYLDHNPLKQFYLNTSVNLETLSLTHCQLETFDERATQRLSTLSELNLSYNNIKNLSGKALAHMKELNVINLANNKLEKLDDDIFSGTISLTKITLDGNKFNTLPNFRTETGEVFTTYTFSCNNCGLKSLPSSVFQKMPAVVDLQLSHNEFMHVDPIVQQIPSLKILDISYNNIAYISPTAFINNRNLETLNIAGNPLVTLNLEVFAYNHVLKKLDARNTGLEKLWSNNKKPIESLQYLLIGNNHLITLTTDDFKVMPNLRFVDINDNPLEFTDQFCNVLNWLDDNDVKPIKPAKYIDNSIEGPYHFELFSSMSWKEFYNEKCPELPNDLVTPAETWKLDEDIELENDSEDSTNEYDEDEDDDDEYNYDDELEADEAALNKYVENENNALGRASYILSVTSVFILTALIVLTLAVTITLTILRRNSNFNMHQANLPRLKIPLWNSAPSQKKHSGSVYRPLSEDLSGPKTPKLSRYEFAPTPTVHSSNP